MLTLGGLLIGVVLALSSARLITTLLYGFEPEYEGHRHWYRASSSPWRRSRPLCPLAGPRRVDPNVALQHE